MIKHMIIWTLKDEVKDDFSLKFKIKSELEGLVGEIPGLIDLTVEINPHGLSNADMMLDSTFEDERSLREYAMNPLHVAVADGYVRPNVSIRSCFDYEV